MSRDFWKGRRVFITGHTGFKGTWLCLLLEHLGAKVTGYALDAPTRPSLFELTGLKHRIDSIHGDVRDLPALRQAMERAKPQVAIHMAAQALVLESYRQPVDTYATNVMGTVHFLEAARGMADLRSAVVVTSDKCYENRERAEGYREDEPMGGYDPYSSSKGCAELVVSAYRRSFFQEGKTAVASVRAGNVIGGGDWADNRIVPDCMRALLAGRTISVRNPQAVRPWQLVLEPLAGYLLLARRLCDSPGQFASGWNFGPGEHDARPVGWIVQRVVDLWGQGAGWECRSQPQAHEAHLLKLDCSKAATKLDWAPRTSLDVALQWIVKWYKEYQAGKDPHAICMDQIRDFMAL